MAKLDLGTKRLCGSCGAKFYDLNKNPIVCPKCETVFVPPVVTARGRPAEPVKAPVAPVAVEPETADAEFVSLEDADAEAQGKKPAAGEEAAEGEAAAGEDDNMDAFIEEEDGGADVTDIVGDGSEKEEES
ncbi:MAG: TIGR02300 family protein [Pseudolabrys sp.]|nr:TIGR02300 family protein [Pseudolabrys sp.]